MCVYLRRSKNCFPVCQVVNIECLLHQMNFIHNKRSDTEQKVSREQLTLLKVDVVKKQRTYTEISEWSPITIWILVDLKENNGRSYKFQKNKT